MKRTISSGTMPIKASTMLVLMNWYETMAEYKSQFQKSNFYSRYVGTLLDGRLKYQASVFR